MKNSKAWLALSQRLEPVSRIIPGFALSGVLAMAATLVSVQHGGPQFLYALFFGIAFHYLSADKRVKPGVEFCSRMVLRLGVGLLGARITAEQIIGLGWTTALIVVLAVVSTLLCGAWLGKRLGLSLQQGVLSGGAVAICGASAALAISAVLPRNKDSERFTLMVVVTVTVLSTVAMVLYPALVQALDLPAHLAGLFLGGTIHDVAQVVGAGYTIGPVTGDYATIVKLFRVAMLVVVVVVVSAMFKKEREQAEQQIQQEGGGGSKSKQALIPWFLWMFVGLVIVNSLAWIPNTWQMQLSDISRGCLVLAIAALGMKTSFAQLAQTGWRPFVLLLTETIWMALLVLIGVELVS